MRCPRPFKNRRYKPSNLPRNRKEKAALQAAQNGPAPAIWGAMSWPFCGEPDRTETPGIGVRSGGLNSRLFGAEILENFLDILGIEGDVFSGAERPKSVRDFGVIPVAVVAGDLLPWPAVGDASGGRK